MSPRIVITFLAGSSLEGERREFDSAEVTLGRHPNNDVAFDAHRDRLVSTHHARIRIEGTALWIEDLGSSNGTFVNDKRITGKHRLRLGDAVVLGPKGALITLFSPVLGDESGPEVHVPATQAAPAPGLGRETVMGMMEKATAKERGKNRQLLIVLGLVSLLLLTGVIVGLLWLVSGGADDIVRDAARKEAQETARDEAEFTARETAKDIAERTANRKIEGAAKELDRRIAQAGRTFRDVFPAIEPSVYPVFVRRTLDGKQRLQSGGGTCWVVAPGVLATNAHVAASHRPPNSQLIVRGGFSTRDMVVTSVEIHPGYNLWSRLLEEYRPIEAGGRKFLRFVPAYDVALLKVSSADALALGLPLPLASDEELKSLTRGTPAAFLGFPTEGTIVGALERGEAASDVGPVSQVLDFFLESNLPEHERLVAYNLKAEGGSSGSPAFGLDGKVFAVHSAGNFKFIGSNRISQGGTTFGQRIDLVREMLEGRGKEATKAIEPLWRERLLALWKKVRDPAAARRALGPRLGFSSGRQVYRRKLSSGTLKSGESKSIPFDAGTRKNWKVAAIVTGDNFATLGFKGAVKTSARSWTTTARGSRSGRQTLEVYRPQDGGAEVGYEVWFYYDS